MIDLCKLPGPVSFAAFLAVVACEAIHFKRRVTATQKNRANDRYVLMNLFAKIPYHRPARRDDFQLPVDDADIDALAAGNKKLTFTILATGLAWFAFASMLTAACR